MFKAHQLFKKTLCFVLVFLMATGGTISASAATSAIPYDTKVTDTLNTILTNSTDETQRVMIWLQDVDTNAAVAQAWSMTASDYAERILYITTATTLTEAEEEELDTYIAQKRSAKKSVYQKYTATFSQKYLEESEIIYASAYTPAILAELTPARVRALAGNELVVKMDFYDDSVVEDDTVAETQSTPSGFYTTASQVAYINADDVHTQFAATGSNISIGILDNYLPADDQGIHYEPHYDRKEGTPNDYHSTCILEIIYAVAPDANFYCAAYCGTVHSPQPTLVEELEWFVDCGVDVVSISLSLGLDGSSDPNDTYGAVAEYIDIVIYRYDMIIVKSSGNSGSAGVTSGGMAYNGLAVGNFNRYTGSIASGSSYSNSKKKPDLCAPGSFALTYNNITDGGTSFSAPMVVGTIALMMSARQALRVNPTAVKAILTASVSKNTTHHYVPTDSNYRYYGAGIIDAYNAVYVAMNNLWISDCMDPEDQNYQISTYIHAADCIRISLAFEKKVAFNEEASLANLNICLLNDDGVIVDSCETTYNNIEIIEFDVSTSGTYTIVVQNISSATNVDNSTEYSTIFSVAWQIE